MVEEQETIVHEPDEAGASMAPPPDETDQRDTPGSEARAETTSGWPDLDAYLAQLSAEHAAWAERLTLVQTQLAAVRPAVLGIATQYAALGIEEDLARLNELVLGGAAMVQAVRFAFDLERYVTLFWPVARDPRPEMARPEAEGEYRIELWLLVGPDGRGRIRVEGAKRLEAPLPTTRERLRRVLLSALQAPRYVAASAAEGEEEPVEQQPQSAPEPDEQPVEQASPRPGDPEEQPPPEEQVIPLGPSAEPTPEQPKQEA